MEFVTILTTIASLLFAGNIFFIKRMVDKVEANNVSNQRMENALHNLDVQQKEIKQDIKDLRKIEIDVAILKHKDEKKES